MFVEFSRVERAELVNIVSFVCVVGRCDAGKQRARTRKNTTTQRNRQVTLVSYIAAVSRCVACLHYRPVIGRPRKPF